MGYNDDVIGRKVAETMWAGFGISSPRQINPEWDNMFTLGRAAKNAIKNHEILPLIELNRKRVTNITVYLLAVATHLLLTPPE